MRMITLLMLLAPFFHAHAGPGGTGGGPIKPGQNQLLLSKVVDNSALINLIDNIEVDNEVKFPKSYNEKIELLKKPEIQSIQLIDGQIISY